MTSRREILCGLGALLATGCPHPTAFDAPIAGEVVMGWRWVPGMELAYQTTLVRHTERVRVVRAELWTYVIRDLVDNVAIIEGRLTAFGVKASVDRSPFSPEQLADSIAAEKRDNQPPVDLRITMDGRLVHCSEKRFARTLPHRMLGLRFPRLPVVVDDEWSDPALTRPFADLFPIDLDLRVRGHARLTGMRAEGTDTHAAISSRGVIQSEGGFNLLLTGNTSWDASRGVMRSRNLRALFQPPGGDPIQSPGTLDISLERV